jgi:hypothetical protein
MGILGYAEVDVAEMSARDERVADEMEARHAEIVRVAGSA